MRWWPWGRQTRSQPLRLEQLLSPDGGSFADVSRSVTADSALRLSAVWACVRLLSDTLSTLPIDVFRQGSRDPLPTPPLLRRPAAGWAFHEWTYAVMVSLLLKGNAFGLITARSGSTMRPAQVEIVHPDLVTVTVMPDGRVEYRYRGNVIDRDDLWHVRAFVFPGEPAGLSPVAYARQTVGMGLASQRFGVQFFEDGAAPMGLLSTDQSVTMAQATTTKARFVDATRGTREPIVLGGGIKYQQMAVNPVDFQWIEQQRFTVGDVARIFGVPPEMVGADSGDSLTYANVEGRDASLVKYTLSPWLVRLESALGELLPRGQFAKFNVDALLRSTTKARFDAYSVALNKAPFMSVDEVRQLEDLPPAQGTLPGVA